MTKALILSAVLAASALLAAGSANAVTLVAGGNGGFEQVQLNGTETTPITGPWTSDNPADWPGWTHAGTVGDALLWNKNYIDSAGVAHAGEGNQFVTMGGGFSGNAGTSSWSTTITGLTGGTSYNLNFLIANEANPALPGPQTVSVSLNGGAFVPFTTLILTGPAYWGTWESETLLFTAVAGTNSLTFSATTTADVGLDGVSVSDAVGGGPGETPLPAALPLFASGLGAMGFLGWRRKRKATAAA